MPTTIAGRRFIRAAERSRATANMALTRIAIVVPATKEDAANGLRPLGIIAAIPGTASVASPPSTASPTQIDSSRPSPAETMVCKPFDRTKIEVKSSRAIAECW